MASPVPIEAKHYLNFSSSVLTGSLSTVLLPGDIIQVGAATNNGAVVASVITTDGLTFKRIGTGFSLSVWEVQVPSVMAAPTIVLTFSTPYNTVAAIGVLVRGANVTRPNDTNLSLPAVETGVPVPPDAVYSTNQSADLLLFWIGCAVGIGGTAPWENPAVTGDNTIGPGTWDWQEGANNTDLIQPIAICLYTQAVSTQQSLASVGTSAPAPPLDGAAYLVSALTADPVPTGNGQSVLINLPPPITSPCVQPCEVELNPNSHAFGMFYGPGSLPTLPHVPDGPSSFVLSNGITLEV
jgi:hypothetical protein